MKIGILTFNCAYNYGAFLQCYALQEYIKSLGYYVKIINYRPNYLCEKKPKITINTIISKSPYSLYKKLQVFCRKRLYYKKFSEFEKKYFDLTDPVSNADSLIAVINDFDCIIIGSDQVWNKNIIGNDRVWFGDFKIDKKIQLIAYAISAGTPSFSFDDIQFLKKQLPVFKNIMVREYVLKEYLSKISKKTISCVLDPSLMVPSEFWNKLYRKIKIPYEYIIVHQARKSEETLNIARNIAMQLKSVILSTDMYNNSFNKFSKHKIVSPDEFITLVKSAKCIITSSFHVTAFSIINRIPFYTVRLNDNADERSENLLQALGLMDRLIDKNDIPIFHL